MLRVKILLLLVVSTAVLAGCNGTGEAETSSVAGTTPPADTTPPSRPTGLTVAAVGSTWANLSWSASTDNVGVTGYIVLRNGIQIGTPATTTYAETGLSAGAPYSYAVEARDAAGNISLASGSISVTTASVADTTPPTMPTGLTAAAAGSFGANLSWSASTDNVGVTGYIVRRNGTQVATSVATSFADTGLSAATTYSYTVAARDAAGNVSPNSTSVSVTTSGVAGSAPVVQQVTGSFAHKGAVTIAGTGFGAKAQVAPLVWDDASGANVLDKWSGFWPTAAPTPSSNMQYMTPIRGVNPPHNRVGKYLTGAHEGCSDANSGVNVAVWKDFNKVEG